MTNPILLPTLRKIIPTLSLADMPSSLSLTQGTPGLLVAYGYAYHHFEEDIYGNAFIELLDHCLLELEATPISNTLADGLAGVMWVIRHMITMGLIDEENEELIKPLETRLIWSFQEDVKTKDYDLLHGMIGKGMYFLEKPQAASNRQALAHIVLYLNQWVVETEHRISWIDYRYPNQTSQRIYNLGMAHGVPSVIGFLAQVYTHDIEKEIVRKLLEKSVLWLIAQQKDTGVSRFSVVSESTQDSRLAWCYGDLGPALALLAAGKALNRVDWTQKGIEIAQLAVVVP